MTISIHPLFFASVFVLWVLAYHFAYWAPAIARDRSLICWSLGPLGISVVGLRQPPALQVLAQCISGAVVLMAGSYGSLFLLTPAPVSGLAHTSVDVAAAVLLPAVAFTLVRLLLLLWEQQFPLWGEARVLARVERSLAVGAVVIFTDVGRVFVRERFGATPTEFLAMVRA